MGLLATKTTTTVGGGDHQGHWKRTQSQRGCLGPGEDRVAPDSEPAPGSGGEENSRGKASGARGPPQGEAASFWKKDAAAWFRLAEAVMDDNHVVEQRVMCRTVLLHIPHHVLERTRGILTLAATAAHPFTKLKDSGSVHQHPVGSRAGWPETNGATGGDDGGPATE